MEEFKPNSHKYREEKRESIPEKKVEKMISGNARHKKKNDFQKLAGIFLPEDVSDIKSYILLDVIVPLVKKALSDTVEAFLYPEGRHGKSSSASKVSYRSYYDKPTDRYRDGGSPKTRTGYSYDEIILDNRGEAEDVISRMDELISAYGLVSVADLYDLVGITGNYTDNKYGWTDIRTALPVKVREGYMLKLPRVTPLN